MRTKNNVLKCSIQRWNNVKAVWKLKQTSSLTSRIASTHWHAQISSWTACDPECPQVCFMSSMPVMPLSHHLEESMASSLMMTIKLMGTIPSLRVMFQNFAAHWLLYNTFSCIISTPNSTASAFLRFSWLQKCPQTGNDVIKGSVVPLRALVPPVVGDARDPS